MHVRIRAYMYVVVIGMATLGMTFDDLLTGVPQSPHNPGEHLIKTIKRAT